MYGKVRPGSEEPKSRGGELCTGERLLPMRIGSQSSVIAIGRVYSFVITVVKREPCYLIKEESLTDQKVSYSRLTKSRGLNRGFLYIQGRLPCFFYRNDVSHPVSKSAYLH